MKRIRKETVEIERKGCRRPSLTKGNWEMELGTKDNSKVDDFNIDFV